jgi:hypothetical protein
MHVLSCRLVDAESQLCLHARIRHMFDELWGRQSKRTLPPSVWSIILRYEAAQPEGRTKLRSLFERWLSSADAAHRRCAVLWMSYMQFELKNGTAANAKRLFYRAINACPQARDIWLSCADDGLVAMFPKDEIEGLVEVMNEKELRVHVELSS